MTARPIVKKEYCEDLGEQDADGYYDYEYRYWVYWFDVDGRNYRARVYTDTPKQADVTGMDGTRHPQFEEDQRIIGAYLRDEAGIRKVTYGYKRTLKTRRL